MAEILIDELWVCSDCAQIIANGPGGMDLSEEEENRIVEALGDRYWVLDYDSETGAGIDDFSRRQCDGCGSHLGGSRHRAVVFES